jgi:hypothetical protein
MEDFPTAADAFFELVDNPIDYRRGRRLSVSIEVNKEADRVVVQDIQGEGMDAEGVADWLGWGTGHPHGGSDIGRFHKGGKAACGYLADSIRIFTRRAGQSAVWMFEDTNWKTRTDWKDYGEAIPYQGRIPRELVDVSPTAGFTRLELSNLEKNRRYDIARLKWKLSSTYRKLLEEGALTITLNGDPIRPLRLPLSSAFKRRELDVRLSSGRRIRGWVGRLDRDALQTSYRLQGGIRCLFQGRMITEGQYFGHVAEGKGLLASLTGEIELSHLRPLSNKVGFQTDSDDWLEVEQAMYQSLKPVIAEFRHASDVQPVTREERKKVSQVRRQLAEALKDLTSGRDPGEKAAVGVDGGRKPPQPRNVVTPAPMIIDSGQIRAAPQPRTPAPPNSVGVLKRLRRSLGAGNDMPPIELVEVDESVRSSSDRRDGRVTHIRINKKYCLYQDLEGMEGYLAETALFELLSPDEGEQRSVAEFLAEVGQCLHAWHKVANAEARGDDAVAG